MNETTKVLRDLINELKHGRVIHPILADQMLDRIEEAHKKETAIYASMQKELEKLSD